MINDRLHDKIVYSSSGNPIMNHEVGQIGQPKMALSLKVVRDWLNHASQDAGTRLPPERKLAEALDLSRPELRKALAVLENEGRIYRHVGRGTFVTSPSNIMPTPESLSSLTQRTGPHDAMMARMALEPELAQLAALHATPLQISRAQALTQNIRTATTWEDYEQLDHALHDLIAESAGNVLLHELHKIMNAVRQVVVWRKLAPGISGPPVGYHSFDEHDAIVAAIASRDRTAARTAMRAHLQSTLNTMTEDA
jgi:DNA-binding FadR family transcriptional regulator